MTFYNTIMELQKNIEHQLPYPINVLITNSSAIYINKQIYYSRNITEIMFDEMPNINDISIIRINNHNEINFLSLDSKYSDTEIICDKKIEIEEFLNYYEYIGIIEDNKYAIYIEVIENIKFEENGFICEESLDYETYKYEFDKIQLPEFKDLQYKNLYKYQEENEFNYVIYTEFILRQVRNSGYFLNSTISTVIEDGDTEEEILLKENEKLQKIEEETDNILIKKFGLNFQEIMGLKRIHNYLLNYKKDNVFFKLKFNNFFIKNCELNLMLSKEELIEQVDKLKDEFDYCLNLREKINKNYINNCNEVLAKFPKKFKKKQDNLIKALYIYDFIQARKIYNKRLDELSIEAKSKENMLGNPKLNPKNSDSIFYEIARNINEKAGQAKKLYYHIHKFLN